MVDVADTAFSIAIVRAEEGKKPEAERLFEDPFASLFVPTGDAAEATERYLGLPFFRDGVRLRTRYIDDAVKEGLGEVEQLVILGAGFDARALRLPEAGSARVFEIDTPAQLERKHRILSEGGVNIPERIAYVPFDFAASATLDPLLGELEARGFRSGGGAVFVWEGVIAYITSDAVDDSMRFMARAGGPRSRLVFTYSDLILEPRTAAIRTKEAGFDRFEGTASDELWRRYGLPGEAPSSAPFMTLGTAFIA